MPKVYRPSLAKLAAHPLTCLETCQSHSATGLNSPDQNKNNDNDKNESQAATWEIPPIAAVRPRWQRADQKQYQYDNQYGSEVHSDLHLKETMIPN